MLNLNEIQRAHDILHPVAAREIDLGLSDENRAKLHAVHDALSWVLEYPCGLTFAIILAKVVEVAAEKGYVLVDTQK